MEDLDTVFAAARRIKALEDIMRKVVNYASDAGTDSSGWEMVKMRRALIDQAREVLANG